MTDRGLLPRPPAEDDATREGAATPRPAAPRSPRRWPVSTRLVLAGSLGWLLFVVAHRLLSGRTWVWEPVDLLPPLVFATIPVLLLVVAPFARPVRWRVLAVVALAGLLGAGNSGVNYASLWYDAPPAPPGAITVVSWNTEYWDQNWREGGWGREPEFYRYLRGLDADVYLLKEYIHLDPTPPLRLENVDGIDRLERLRRVFPDFRIAVGGSQITISRFPIVFERGLDAGPWLPADLREMPPEMADFPDFNVETLRTDLLVHGTVISFYNSHIIQPEDDVRLYRAETRRITQEAHERRKASLQVLRADIEANQRPVVLGADMNASPVTGLLRLLPDELVDRTPATGSIVPRTWQVDGLRLWRFALELWLIDWLFTTADVAVHEYDLVHPAGLSDHRVLRAVLSLEAS